MGISRESVDLQHPLYLLVPVEESLYPALTQASEVLEWQERFTPEFGRRVLGNYQHPWLKLGHHNYRFPNPIAAKPVKPFVTA